MSQAVVKRQTQPNGWLGGVSPTPPHDLQKVTCDGVTSLDTPLDPCLETIDQWWGDAQCAESEGSPALPRNVCLCLYVSVCLCEYQCLFIHLNLFLFFCDACVYQHTASVLVPVRT